MGRRHKSISQIAQTEACMARNCDVYREYCGLVQSKNVVFIAKEVAFSKIVKLSKTLSF